MSKKIVTLNEKGHVPDIKTSTSHYTLRSEMAQEILSKQPGFLEKWSLIIFLCILIMMLSATWFVHYPDILNAKAILTAENAPKEIIIKQEGRLIKLFVHNNDYVKKGDIIGWIESNSDHQEVISLSKALDSSMLILSMNKGDNIFQLYTHDYNNLGELQQAYQQFLSAKQLFNDYTLNGFYLRKLNMLTADVKSLNSLNENLIKQRKLTEQDLGLAKETFDINKILLDKKVITVAEYRNERSKYVNKEKTVPQLDVSLYNNEMQKREKEKEIEQLSHDMNQQRNIFRQEVQFFRSKIIDWKNKYIIHAPTDGKIFYTASLQESKYLRLGSLIGYVNPTKSLYYAETVLSQNNFGRIDTGMHVQLRFDAYPFEEWGYLDGTLSHISDVPTDSGFLAIVRLDKGLMTNNHKKLVYKNGLKANALIITNDMRLLQRLYYNFVKSTSLGNR